jgi:uncharacterized protein YunC (DUF1805 family)
MNELIAVADSITKLGPEFRNRVLIAGSHGGRYCGYLAALGGLAGVILNDAGVGKDRAGIGCLEYLERLEVGAATVAHTSARIGDGADMRQRGTISHANNAARELGVEIGMSAEESATRLTRGRPFEGEAEPYDEARFDIEPLGHGWLGVDSASLVREEDSGRFIVTGSHGGILAARPGYGLAVKASGAVFNDAGIGIDDAGLRRLPVLDRAGVPAVTVAHSSARIGDARSAWSEGIISAVNDHAKRLGVREGMPTKAFAERISG